MICARLVARFSLAKIARFNSFRVVIHLPATFWAINLSAWIQRRSVFVLTPPRSLASVRVSRSLGLIKSF
tara:strand:- start:1517 stop:1726 length:210 start_codon:yes stop_codon:yes gene_type:complete